jgi:hypothetical protein
MGNFYPRFRRQPRKEQIGAVSASRRAVNYFDLYFDLGRRRQNDQHDLWVNGMTSRSVCRR